MSFILKMAWRDSRRNRARLFLFISAITVGIAALTAVRSFSVNLTGDIDREAKTLLGADLLVDANQEAPDSVLQLLNQPGAERSDVINFMSMVRFPGNGGTRLSQIRALEGDYPFYGKWKSSPENSWKTFRSGKAALVDHALMLQFNIRPGDSIQVGNVTFAIEGDLLSSPGRAGIASSIAPVVFIPAAWLDSTGLIQRGSRVDYQYFYKMPAGTDPDALMKPLEKQFEKAGLGWDTVEERKRSIGKAFGNFGTFLNLVGFIALLLGCIGVAGAVHIYIKDKLPTVAILRCLGASGRKAFFVYLVQVAGIGMLGALAGAALGSLIQKFLPWVVRDLLPIDNVSTDLSWSAMAQGVALGLSVAILFALLPLSGILKTSPLRTLRASFGENESSSRPLRWGVYALILAAIFGFTWWLIKDWKETLYFMGGIAAAFLILWGVAWLLTFLLRRFFPKKWSYVARQGIANLFRPENQTVLLVVTIGLGTMLLSTLFLIQNLLLKQVEFSGSGNQPNMILFDIQTRDRDSVAALVRAHDMPLMQQVAVVTTRVESIDGITKAQYEADTLNNRPPDTEKPPRRDEPDNAGRMRGWVWDREYRVTFRDTLIDTEEIVDGVWEGKHVPGEPIKVSISDGLQRGMNAKIGTKIVFNVQGARLETEVGSIRKVDFNRVQTNFLVVFPTGVLEKAPQFHVVISRVGNAEQSARFQSELVRRFPGVSAIDLTQILKSVDEVLGKVSFVIRFMALFSILTGLLVLISSIYQGKFARIRESVLLRTLGASRRQILAINALEYFLLGALACLAGVGLSVAGAWALAEFAFHIPFEPEWWPLLTTFLVITSLTVIIGLLNSREVVRKPPLEVLRQEV
ncbi:MAG: FtsX-like permease family protein [Lewinellaceae bacterium]|jgi:putative ABC transport system permease protein|nr:FtsX-like permease family protein [Lewinellaceae bacterium]